VAAEARPGYPTIVALVSGDLVPALVERIDDKGVWIRSPIIAEAGGTAVPIADPLLKAIEFDPEAATQGIPRDRFERLLTVPRSQQSDPPTHLLRLRGGDYLRGKLVSLDQTHVTFEVVGQKKRLPRDGIVRLIWLHPDDLGPDDKERHREAPRPTDGLKENGGLVVQGIGSGGQRATIEAERVEGSTIIGRSLALGPARIDTRQVDRILVGRAIEDGNEDLPFAKWRLRLAPLPRALRDKK
jgi:hypothetical protein